MKRKKRGRLIGSVWGEDLEGEKKNNGSKEWGQEKVKTEGGVLWSCVLPLHSEKVLI